IGVTSGDLQHLSQGKNTLSVSITDKYGNTNTKTEQFNVETASTGNPALKVNAFAGDNILNHNESLASQVLSGSTTASNAGRTVTVTLGGKTYTGLVGKDGSWSINIPTAD
ncbi:hypothetical protein, partial [Hafnia alvei]